MSFVVGLAIGIAIATVLIILFFDGKKNSQKNIYRTSEKAEKLRELAKIIAETDQKITNDFVQDRLNISDATATRYLDELEKEGLIKQIGDTGKHTYYKKI